MGRRFNELLRTLMDLTPTQPDATDQVTAAKRLAEMPAFMASVRSTYEATSTVGKSILRKRARSILEQLRTTTPTTVKADPRRSVGPFVRHVVTYVRLHEHHSQPDIQKWAQVCNELHGDPAALEVLCRFVDQEVDMDAELYKLLHGVLTWLVSECNRLGAPVRPFCEAP